MSLKTLLSKIGLFFSHLFNAAQKTWDKLSPEIQTAFKQASGIIELINEKVAESPQDIKDAIAAKWPELSEDKIHEGLGKVIDALNVGEDAANGSLLDAIKVLQSYLDKTQGAKWAGISSLASKTMAFFLAPKGQKWAVFESLMEFVFQRFIKKN